MNVDAEVDGIDKGENLDDTTIDQQMYKTVEVRTSCNGSPSVGFRG